MRFNITPFQKYIIRTPFLPIDDFNSSNKHDDIDDFLKEFFSRIEVKSAIYNASSDFLNEVLSFLNNEFNNELDYKRTKRFRSKALKYINRMTTRCTPFGIFAGCGVGSISLETSIIPDSKSKRFTKKHRIDTACLVGIVESIVNRVNINQFLKFYSNNSIYAVGENNRYVDFVLTSNDIKYNLSAFEANDYIDHILDMSKRGCYYKDILDFLISDGNEYDISVSFINELITSKILISELEPNIIGVEYQNQVIQIFEKVLNSDIDEEERKILQRLTSELKQIKENLDLMSDKNYEFEEVLKITKKLKEIPSVFNLNNFIQIDSKINFLTNTLSKSDVDDIKNGMKFYFGLTNLSSQSDKLSNFIKQYRKKYEERSVKLIEALDPEFGVGYGAFTDEYLVYTPIVDDIVIPKKSDDSITFSWDNRIHSFLFKKIIESIKNNSDEIVIEKSEMDDFSFDIQHIPPTSVAFVNLYNGLPNKRIVFKSWGSDTAATSIARFSMLDNQIHDLLAEINNFEESSLNSNQVLAEINHLPNTRTGNIITRTRFRNFEIPYVTISNIADQNEKIVDINDLYIKIIDDKIRLFEYKKKTEIIPILSNAHNFNNNTLPIYKFLSDIQNQSQIGRHYMDFNVGFLSQMFDYIPRIRFQNYIFRPSTWRLYKKDFDFLWDLPLDEKKEKIVKILNKKCIPLVFYISDGDNRLYINFREALTASLILFEDEISKNNSINVEEYPLFPESTEIVNNSEGFFSSELVIPFRNENSKNFNEYVLTKEDVDNEERFLSVGSDCLYLKIYCGNNLRDKIINNYLPGFVKLLKDESLINKWFFIRFTDDSTHIRLRLFKNNISYDKILKLYNEYFKDILNNGQISKTEISSYNRELDRYGGMKYISYAEKIFEIDSEMHLSILPLIEKNSLKDKYWLFLIKIVDYYLDSFEMEINRKHSFTEFCKNYFSKEFNSNKTQRRSFIEKYRTNEVNIEIFINDEKFKQIPGGLDFLNVLHVFKQKINKEFSESYINYAEKEQMIFLQSFIHMSILRGVISKNRVHEFTIYSLMENYYRNEINKNKHNIKEI